MRPRPSGSASRTPPRAQAAKDAELAAKLAVGAEATSAKATGPKAKADTTAKATVKAEPKGKTETATNAKADTKPAAKPAAKSTAATSKAKSRDQGHGREAGVRQGRRSRQGRRAEEAAYHQEGRVDEMAHKKAGGSVKNGRDSVGQRLGVKAGDGQLVPRRIDHRPTARDDVPESDPAPGSATITPSSRRSPAR